MVDDLSIVFKSTLFTFAMPLLDYGAVMALLPQPPGGQSCAHACLIPTF